MKNILILLFTALSLSSNAQIERFSMLEIYSDVLPNSASMKPICVNFDGDYTVASINASKYVPYFPDQRGGNMRVNNFAPYSSISKWELNFTGTIFPFQLIYANDAYYVAGVITDSIGVNGNTHVAIDSNRVYSFVASIKYNGQLNWLKIVEDSIWNSMATSICVLPSGNLLVTALYHDVESVVWKLNPRNGNTISTKYFTGVRTLSDIKYQNDKVYLAGSTSDFAMVDTFQIINPMQNGYVNFMCIADTNLTVNKIVYNPYITFDFSSKLTLHNGGVLWAHYELVSPMSLFQNLSYYTEADTFSFKHYFKTDMNLSEFENNLVFAKYYDGDFIFIKKLNKDYYMFNFFTSSRDSIRISTDSKFSIYDLAHIQSRNELAILGMFENDTLHYLNKQILNPYAASNQSAGFISRIANTNSGISSSGNNALQFYPNPVNDEITLQVDDLEKVEIVDLNGKIIDRKYDTKKISCIELNAGMYLLKVFTKNEILVAKFIKK